MSQCHGCKTWACFLALNLCKCQNPSRDSRFGTKCLIFTTIYLRQWTCSGWPFECCGIFRLEAEGWPPLNDYVEGSPGILAWQTNEKLWMKLRNNNTSFSSTLPSLKSRTCEQTVAVLDGDSANHLVFARVSRAVCVYDSHASNGLLTTTVTPTQSVPWTTCISKSLFHNCLVIGPRGDWVVFRPQTAGSLHGRDIRWIYRRL